MSDIVPGIQEGPYIKVPDDDTKPGEKVRFTVKIPDDLLKDGRTFYLLTVDEDGNIIILENESLENGEITATGIAGATYQIIYEDGGSTLSDHLTSDGTILSEDGKELQVSTKHCFWHWLILLVTLLGAVAGIILGRRKKKYTWPIFAGTDVLIILLAIAGSCKLDWLFAVVCMILLLLTGFVFHKKNRDTVEEQ